jgi:hypothetical protein
MKLKPGDTVGVVGSRGTAKIRAILTSMHGALLEKQIEGFRTWNLDELQIQFLLRYVFVQTTEKYLGCKQRFREAVNDRLGIEPVFS